MGKMNLKYEQLNKSLDRLYEAVTDFNNFKNYVTSPENEERIYRTYRDSMIQRFEFSVDLFWKYIKKYLEEEIKQDIKIAGPKPIIRDACKAKLISEKDAKIIINMINDRNMSSHIYKEEIANQIGTRIGNYYKLIRTYTDKLTPTDLQLNEK